MASILEHALLGVSVVALGTAGSRAGAALGARGLPRLLAAAPLAATAAAIEVLALGLVDLGSDPVALTFVALTTSLLAAWLLPRPQRRLVDELVHGWRGISSRIRIAAAAAAGALAALTIWFLANPAQVADGLVYHLPVVVAWVDGGDPPSLVPVGIDAPVEAYPLTNELLLTWAVGISRGFAAATVWTPAMLTLLALAAWAGLRRLEVPELVAGLAVAALVTTPLLVRPLNSTETEIPAMAWLVCCAALCVWSLRTPGMLIPAVCAAALAIGTKTTAAPLALACVIAALVAVRARLRPLAWMLAATGVAAAVVGGLWYARNLILHGSPLWPFVTTPWGDALPLAFESTNGRLLWDPSSAQGRLDDYARFLYGALVLLAGGVLAPLLVRTRRVLAASAATALATLIWANAPYTALPADPVFDGLQAGATRYLVPAMAAAALALALAGSGRVAGSDLAKALLAGALLANLTGIATLGVIGEYEPAAALEPDPILPTAAVPLAGAVLGGAVAVLLSRARRGELQRPGWWPVSRRMGWIVGAVLAGALLAIPDSGYVERSTRLSSSPAGAEWLVRQERYVEHDDPVAMQNRTVATLAGDRLSHRLNLIPAHPECSQLQDAVHEGWTVLPVPGPSVAEDGLVVPGLELRERRVRAGELAAARCLAGRDPAYDDGKLRIYAPDRGGVVLHRGGG